MNSRPFCASFPSARTSPTILGLAPPTFQTRTTPHQSAGEGGRNVLEKHEHGKGKAAANAPPACAGTEGHADGAADALSAAGHPTARVDGRDQVQNSRMNENVHALRYIQNIRGVSDWNTSVAEYQSCSGGNSLSIAEKATDYFFCSGV